MDSERIKSGQGTLALGREKFRWVKELSNRKKKLKEKRLENDSKKTENGIRTQRANVEDGA